MNNGHPSWFDWITVCAIVTGPVFALWAQRGLDHLREKKQQRPRMYLTLMSTRATWLVPAHVEAVNSIDVVFNGWLDKKVRAAWKKVLEHAATDTHGEGWTDRLTDLRVDLYREIGLRVGYDFNTDYLKRQFYAPMYFSELETEQMTIRKGLARALGGGDGIRVRLVEPSFELPNDQIEREVTVKTIAQGDNGGQHE